MSNKNEKKLNGTVIVTYRCNARCSMCNRYKAPSKPEEEISIETIKKLPKMYFTNITGGEPFIRTDLKDIVRELYKKSDRIVISTNGFFTDRIVDLCKEFPQIGIRISIEGLEQTNNEIRGLQNGYQRGYQTLKTLREMGMKDVGFGMTVQDKNAPDLVPLYKISDEMGMEFATASLHNSFYFVEAKNIIHDRPMVAKNFEDLVNELLRSNSPKKWFRAYFNHGLINYIYGQKRLLPCDMSFDTFFIDPYGDVMCYSEDDHILTKFSSDCAAGIFDGCTVTYSAIQMACYMGFDEIYLLGCDTNHAGHVDDNSNQNKKAANDTWYALIHAYEVAKEYADEHGIKIYNATRGGMLEVFPRVDFDTLFLNRKVFE